MGSLRPSMRSKVSGQLGHHLPNGTVSREELSAFESDAFDADAYVQGKCQSVSEKGIKKLCGELLDLKNKSAEEMRKSVYANYSAFIQTSREISELETQLVSMRNYLTTQAALVHRLADIHLPAVSENGGSFPHENGHLDDDPNSGTEAKVEQLLEVVDIHINERRTQKALETLEKCEAIMQGQAGEGKDLVRLLTDRKIRLAELLTHLAKQPSVRGAELRSVISALCSLGEEPSARTLLLEAHSDRLLRWIGDLRPSGTSYGGAYTAGLCQRVFSQIAQAAKDFELVFKDQPSYASNLFVWAEKETKNVVALLEKRVLSASAASGGLRAAAECVQIALGHCSLLEDYGLALSPFLTKLVKPSVEQALEANIRRIEDSVSVRAAVDNWTLAQPPSRTRLRGASSLVFPPHVRLSTSAYHFIAMVQDFVDDVTPLTSMQLTSTTVDGVGRLFDSYIHLLMRAMAGPLEDQEFPEVSDNLNIEVAETVAEKMCILANAATLADELLPRVIAKILPLIERDVKDLRRSTNEKLAGAVRPEYKDFRRKIQRTVDKLRDRLCQMYALELIYGEDGDPLLSAETYLKLDGDGETSSWHDEPMPSPVFQALFERFNSIASAGAEAMPRKDRFVTVTLIRLVESAMMLISDYQDLWEDIEDGPTPLGPIGLHQIILDMHFALETAGRVNHPSLRRLNECVSEIVSRAMNAYGATGMNPSSVLPDFSWFEQKAQEAADKLSIGWTKDTNSPTASVSAHSVSSFRSHGSP